MPGIARQRFTATRLDPLASGHRSERRQTSLRNYQDLLVRLGEVAGKFFRRAGFFLLLPNAGPQFNLIRIVRRRRAARQQTSTDDRDEQDGPHVRDHAIRQRNFNHKPITVVLIPATNAFWNPRDRLTHSLRYLSAPDSGACHESRAASHRHIRSGAPGRGQRSAQTARTGLVSPHRVLERSFEKKVFQSI